MIAPKFNRAVKINDNNRKWKQYEKILKTQYVLEVLESIK